MRLPAPQRWDAEELRGMIVTPWNTRKVRETPVMFAEAYRKDHEAAFREPVKRAKIFRIEYTDLPAHGFTGNCAKCDEFIKYGPGNSTSNHTDACRTRIARELATTEERRGRLERAEMRLNKALADDTENHDRKARTTDGPEEGIVEGAAPHAVGA